MTLGRAAAAVSAAIMLPLVGAAAASAQTFEGRVLDEQDERPVPTALIRLIDPRGVQHSVSIADSSGHFRLGAPGPGTYRLEAARLGYEDFETPLFAVSVVDGVYPVDLLLVRAPVELPGLAVRMQRIANEEADREIRREIGVSTAQLRYEPIRFDEITHHIEMGRGLVDLIRAEDVPGLTISLTLEGWCFSLRQRDCLPVFLNGLPLLMDFVDGAPLDMLHTIVIVSQNDGSIVYPNGAILLYTEAWLG